MLKLARSIIACLIVGALLSSCDDRAPLSTMYGTWEMPTSSVEPLYMEFKPDQSFIFLDDAGQPLNLGGRWYAGGENIYLRLPQLWSDEDPRRPTILHIVDISPNEIQFRVRRDGEVWSMKRVAFTPTHASNQPMQPTAGRTEAKP